MDCPGLHCDGLRGRRSLFKVAVAAAVLVLAGAGAAIAKALAVLIFVFVRAPRQPKAANGREQRPPERSGLPPIRLHDLRYGAATMLLAAGQPPKVISEVLGHSTVSFTMDVYTQVAEELAEPAGVAIAAYIPRAGRARMCQTGAVTVADVTGGVARIQAKSQVRQCGVSGAGHSGRLGLIASAIRPA